eukprot:m.1517708 g.1517708  ORF g.1517708 m.1517708 type:complete len:555 (+) comp25218_c1_seq59:2298-3962(+)
MFDKVGAEDVRVPGVAALGVERADVLVYTTQRTCTDATRTPENDLTDIHTHNRAVLHAGLQCGDPRKQVWCTRTTTLKAATSSQSTDNGFPLAGEAAHAATAQGPMAPMPHRPRQAPQKSIAPPALRHARQHMQHAPDTTGRSCVGGYYTCEQRGDRGLGLCHGGFRLRRECPRPRVVCLQRSVAHGARGNVVEILCQQGLVAANNLCKRQGLLRSRLRHAVGHPRHGAAHGGACHGDVDVTRGQEAGFHGCCQCWLNKSEEKQAPQHTFFHGRELQRHLSAQVVQHPAHYVRDLAGLVGEGAVEVLQQQRQGALVLPHFLRGGPRSDNIHPRLGGDGAERIAENVVKKSPRRVFQQHRQNANGARVGTEQEGGVGRVHDFDAGTLAGKHVGKAHVPTQRHHCLGVCHRQCRPRQERIRQRWRMQHHGQTLRHAPAINGVVGVVERHVQHGSEIARDRGGGVGGAGWEAPLQCVEIKQQRRKHGRTRRHGLAGKAPIAEHVGQWRRLCTVGRRRGIVVRAVRCRQHNTVVGDASMHHPSELATNPLPQLPLCRL